MNPFDKIIATHDQIKALDELEKSMLFDMLFESKSIDFIQLSQRYVMSLEQDRNNNQEIKSKLILYLSMTAANEKNIFSKQARKYLWENKWMEGCEFGNALIEEFGPWQPPTTEQVIQKMMAS